MQLAITNQFKLSKKGYAVSKIMETVGCILVGGSVASVTAAFCGAVKHWAKKKIKKM